MATTQGVDQGKAPPREDHRISPRRRVRIIRRRLVRLALDEWQLWMAAGGVALAVIATYPFAPTLHQQITYSGAILQVLGLGTVAWGLRKTRRLFNQPGLLAKLAKAFAKPRTTRVNLRAAVSASSALSASVKVGVPKNATNEQRLAALERRVDQIETSVREDKKKQSEEIADLKKRLGSEETERKREDSALHKRIEAAVIGGLRLEQAGLAWLVFGVVMSAAPASVAWITRPVRLMLGLG